MCPFQSIAAGSEAAAATGGHLIVDSVNEFQAISPFIVIINEYTTGVILFMGRVCSVHSHMEPIAITSGPHCNHEDIQMSGSGSGQ